MRKLSPAYVVTSIVVAIAGTAFAAVPAVVPGAGGAVRPAPPFASVPVAPATTADSTNTGTTGSANNTLNGPTSNGLNGSRSGNNTDSSAANVPVGSTSATGALTSPNSNTTGVSGSSSVNATTSNSLNPLANGRVLAPAGIGFVNPAFINGGAGGVTNDGERGMGNSANGSRQASIDANGQLQNNGTIGSSVEMDSARSSQSLDRAIKTVERDRKKIGRNGQLLNSIAPRTNADRSNEMPDDAPTPALTGSASTLTRR